MNQRCRTVTLVVLAALAAAVVGLDATQDASSVLGDARQALGRAGGLDEVGALEVTGRTLRLRPDGTTGEYGFELWFEAPDKFVKRSVVMAMGPTSIYRESGFNGDQLIDEMDTPPALMSGGGNYSVRMQWQSDDGSGALSGGPTPAEVAGRREQLIAEAKREFGRLALGIFAGALPAYPLDFRYAGRAESPDGTADVLDVRATDGFEARLFVDSETHLPLMLTWRDLEPLEVVLGSDGDVHAGDGTVAMLTEAEADRREVEYRLVYGDYRVFDGGVTLPTRIQQVVDGTTREETIFDRVDVDADIDPDTFEPTE